MADDMRAPTWKSLASTRLNSFKDYVSQRDLKRLPVRRELRPGEVGYTDGVAKKQSWTQWAGQKIAKRLAGDETGSMEKVNLFPGWASRRYHTEGSNGAEGAPYDIEVFVSGYAVKQRAPGSLTRPQRTFLRLAKSFAALPKLPDPYGTSDSPTYESTPLSRSTEELLATMELPPRPEEMTEESEIRTLLHSRNNSSTNLSASSSSPSPSLYSQSTTSSGLQSDLHRLHMNLESRLNPFWAAALPARTIRVFLYPHVSPDSRPSSSRSAGERAMVEIPIAAEQVPTSPEGAFQVKFTIPWETLCTHPKGVHIAFGDPLQEHEFLVSAELMPLPQPPSSRPTTPGPSPLLYAPAPPQPTSTSEQIVPLTYSPIRVISDIDDTVKLSGVITGARAIFYNVFVKDLRENVIRGMGEWYGDMWKKGVRFHYVSNSPFELLPVISEFFQLAQLPPGSIRLRSYGTRSLFNGLLAAPATRKRAGVLDVLTSFPSSRFILVGDTGEQDLELYVSIARDRPEQILCIFVRDVNTYDDGGGLEDPTGAQALSTGSMPSSPTQAALTPSATPASRSYTGDYFSSHPGGSAPSAESMQGSMTPHRFVADQLTAEPSTYVPPSPSVNGSNSSSASSRVHTPQASLSDSDKRKLTLQLRVWKARVDLPPNVVLRIFREPEECVEAMHVVDGMAPAGSPEPDLDTPKDWMS
ncbi:hypothetical protein BV25DRAFT_1882683 [Artomyces pyxidatus]|uniref:Uncharacterized protein n=1 Tax=Artomyces pyxidatus TaxID=48021 RepID=A0ACB8T717_9AGAM|nr:hypothetical protein BV25DRAFT_1882683 [Artomyces pyxidatus]